MSVKSLTASYLLDSSGVAPGVASADAQFGRLGSSADKMGSDLDATTSKMGKGLEGLGQSLGNWGIPFSNSVTKMGQNLDEAKSHGQGLQQGLSDIGGTALGVGAVALAAVGFESVKMADAFDTAQAQLKTAVTDSGNSFDAMQPKLKAVTAQMANLGFNSTDVESSLTALTIATQSPTKALADEGLAADLAREKGVSLATSTNALAKVYGGSNRALTQMGINLDIGSGKLNTIHTATLAVASAQLGLKTTTDQVSSGSLKGQAAADALTKAHMTLSNAEAKLKLDQDTVTTSLQGLQDRTKGAAQAYSQTLAGGMSVAGAQLHNLGTSFGEFLIPKIVDTEHAVESVVGWFDKNKDAAYALGAIVGGFLAVSVGAFAINMGTKFIGSLTQAATSLGIMGGADEAAASETAQLTAAISQLEGKLGMIIPAQQEIADTSPEVTAAWQTMAAAADEVASGQELIMGQAPGVVAANEAMASSAEGASGAMGTEGLAGDAKGAEGALGDMGGAAAGAEGDLGGASSALGPFALAAAGAGLAAYALGRGISSWTGANAMSAGIKNLVSSANSLPGGTANVAQMQVRMDALTTSMDKNGQSTASNVKDLESLAHDGMGQASTAAAGVLKQYDALSSAIPQTNTNLKVLSSTFGISQNTAQGLANELGLNLAKSLDPKAIQLFSQQLVSSGTPIDATTAKIKGLATNTEATAISMTTSFKTHVPEMTTTTQTGISNMLDAFNNAQFGPAGARAIDRAAAGIASTNSANAATQQAIDNALAAGNLEAAKMLEVGQAMSAGMAQGIAQGGNNVIGQTLGLVDQAIAAAKGKAQINSPSLLFANELGSPIAEGVAFGIAGSAHMAAEAVTSMIDKAAAVSGPGSRASGSLALPGSAPGLSAPASGPVQVNINVGGVVVEGHVLTDQNLVDLIWRGLVEKATTNGTGGQLVLVK